MARFVAKLSAQIADRKRWLRRHARLLLLACAAGCGFTRPACAPMPQVVYRKQLGPEVARGAIVLLPGYGDRPETFIDKGFIKALSPLVPDYDLIGADSHVGYYLNGSMVERLELDVIGPLRKRGYREIWLLGISMGGHGAVAYARSHPEKIRGILLFAPYMGPSEVVHEVAEVGLCNYPKQPTKATDRADFARMNFAWLKQHACTENSGVSLWLAVGDQDEKVREADEVLIKALPPSHVLLLPGGHDWNVWTPAVTRLAKTAFDSSEKLH